MKKTISYNKKQKQLEVNTRKGKRRIYLASKLNDPKMKAKKGESNKQLAMRFYKKQVESANKRGDIVI